MKPGGDWQAAWADYRHRYRMFFLVWLVGFLAVALVCISLGFLGAGEVPAWVLCPA